MDIVDPSTGHKIAIRSSEPSQSGTSGIAIDRHMISPMQSISRELDRRIQVATARGSIGLDETMDNKDFFEPDEISMVSAPHETGGSIMPELSNDA